MKALNAQFAQWVAERAVSSPIVSWAKGCEDYLKHLNGIKVRGSRARGERRIARYARAMDGCVLMLAY